MAVARKSDVSATGGWFRMAVQSGKNRQGSQNKPSIHQETADDEDVAQASNTPVPSRKQRRSAKDKSVSLRHTGIGSGTQRASTTIQELGKQKVPNVPVIPTPGSAPLWLLRLYALHRHSTVVAFLLVAATLVVYGWTVYSQQLWSQAFRQLQNLQRYERQLTTTNEVLKNKMAQEAERSPAKLVSPTPERMLFVRRAPVDPHPEPATTSAPNFETQLPTANPVGY